MAETIHVRGAGGSIFALDLPLHEAIEDQLIKGSLTRVNADGSPYQGDTDDVGSTPTEVPSTTAAKKVWVGWAVAQGCLPDDAEAMTKTDLIEKFGSQ